MFCTFIHNEADSDISQVTNYPEWGVLPRYTEEVRKKTGNIDINVTLRRVRLNIVAVEKQYVLHILSVCL
jgi:hypothetical protein